MEAVRADVCDDGVGVVGVGAYARGGEYWVG